MHVATQWQQVPDFQPDNPGQWAQEHYTGLPGGYTTFYWNQIPLTAPLLGAGDSSPSWLKTAGFALGGLGLVGLGLVLLRRPKRRRR